MRITNKMMTNNSLYNINNNKNLLNKLEEQYSSGKRINRPSDDPIIAVRALKFRTNLSEVEQYTDKNIPDALNWMEVTEGALDTINSLISSMNTYCNQGANDYLTAENRNSIVINLQQYAKQIYQEGNTNYAGRYVFSGYKTDTPLVFMQDSDDMYYRINQPLDPKDIQIVSVISDGVQIDDFDPDDLAAWDDTMPSTKDVYRMVLGYDKLDDGTLADGPNEFKNSPVLSFVDVNGVEHSSKNGDFAVNVVSITDKTCFDADADGVNFIPETGEIIIGKNLYPLIQKAKSVEAEYTKTGFSQNDLRPEHYYDCQSYNAVTERVISYTKQSQDINYEVNFNQRLKINTQGSDAFTTSIARMVTEISDTVKGVKDIEDQLAQVDKLLSDTTMNDEQLEKLRSIREQLESEYTLRTSLMTDAFQRGLSITQSEQENMNICIADLGGRYKRLLLTQDRLESQAVDFEQLLSDNEDADLVDTIVKYTSANNVFNASLSAASKLVQTSLLDYLS